MWRQPKIDWKPDEFFNVEDYNRIKGNLNEIRTQARILWPDFTYEEMGEDKTYQDYGFYTDEINRFESNIDYICAGTFPFSVGARSTFYDNQPFTDWKELNRIEEACVILHSNIRGRINGIQSISFTLGNRRMFKKEKR